MPLSKQSRRLFVQKAVWIRKDVARRLKKVVRLRKRKKESFSEHVAFALALRAFVEQEEAALGITHKPPGAGPV